MLVDASSARYFHSDQLDGRVQDEIEVQTEHTKMLRRARREQVRKEKENARLAESEKLRAERLAQAFAAKEAAAAEALKTQVVPTWIVDKMLVVAEPGDHFGAEQESQEGPRLPMLLDDALKEIHNDFLAEKAVTEKRLASMGLVAPKPSEVEEDDAIVDATANLSQTAGLADQHFADEVDEEETLVPVPPSPEPWQRATGSGPGTGEIAEELDGPGDVEG